MRGLKFRIFVAHIGTLDVAPHVGAWIEIPPHALLAPPIFVAPHVGAWIEIDAVAEAGVTLECRTPRGCVD